MAGLFIQVFCVYQMTVNESMEDVPVHHGNTVQASFGKKNPLWNY